MKTPTKDQVGNTEGLNRGKEKNNNIDSQDLVNSRTKEIHSAEENSNLLQVSPAPTLRNLDTTLTIAREPPGRTPPQDPNISSLENIKLRPVTASVSLDPS